MFRLKKPKPNKADSDTQDLVDQEVSAFDQGKKKKKWRKRRTDKPEINPELKEQIHVMPQRFYVKPKSKRSGLLIIVVIGVVLIGGLAAFAFYLNTSLKEPPSPPVDTNANVNTNINTNVNVNINANVNTNVATTTVGTNTNINTNVNLNTNANTNANVNVNTNVNPDRLAPRPSAPDTDDDGLTLAEESLYGTNPELSDSDGDGYSDGSELLNGYDPIRPAKTLLESGLFANYQHSLYTIIYPQGWEMREQDEAEVLFVSDVGEFIEVLVIDNVNDLSLRDWYQEQFPQVDLAQTTAVTINNLSGLRHPDNQSYYFMSQQDDKIFLLTYNIGNFTMTNFATTFQVMVKSFKLLGVN